MSKCRGEIIVIINFGSKSIGDGQKVYIVFEAGPTHTGLNSCKKLIDAAALAGADAIKFQIADHKKLMADDDLMFTYEVLKDRNTGETEKVTEPLIDIWERRFLTRNEWVEVSRYCKVKNIDFFATAFFEEDMDFLISIGVSSIKIAAQDINNKLLIQYAAKSKLPIQIDTGAATLGEVERATEWIESTGNTKIIINHCPSGYPANLSSINLNIIKTLVNSYDYPIAFSDHNPGYRMDVVARAFGASVIEKTITLNKETRGCEHMMSLEPDEMSEFVQIIGEVDIALGSSRKTLTLPEIKKRLLVRRTGYLNTNVDKGQALTLDKIDFRRPGLGVVTPEVAEVYLGRVFRSDLEEGHMLIREDFV